MLKLERLEDRLAPSAFVLGQQPGAQNNTEFHGNAARSGFDQVETVLTPTNVASSFGQVWESPVLDGAVYATPLFLDSHLIQDAVSGVNGNAANHSGDGIQSASYMGKSLGVVFAATGGGSVYAIAAQDTNGPTGIAPGTILWKTHLGNAYAGIDGNSIGVLSTPVIDLASGRLYVTASVTDYLSSPSNPNHGGNNFEVFALNLSDGSLVAGWPLIYTQTLLDSLNQNTLQTGTGPKAAVAFSSSGADQRGALNLSPDGSILYVDYACYGSSNGGWMTTVATGVSNGVANAQTAAIISAYSAVDIPGNNLANGGMWGAGGPAIDAKGNVFVTTGDSPTNTGNPPGTWGNSVLEFGPGQTLQLIGAYTPWNYPDQDTIDSDMGGGSPILVNLPAGSSTTTELLATGGKQGNGYLVDAGNNLNNPTPNPNNSPAAYPASLTARPPEGETPDQDASLYNTTSTGIRTYWQGESPQDGPLALFLPYNESSASGNTAKARDTPATFTAPDGSQYVIFAGSTKSGVGSSTPIAPSLIVTQIVHSPGQPAYLQVVAQNNEVMSNPGSNLITGNGTSNDIDWVVDTGMQRTDATTSFSDGAPVLYAFNALTMQPIWSSAYEQLDTPTGKYNSIAVARGNVFVGTNRIQAFGLTSDTIVDDSVIGTGTDQFNYVGAGWTHVTGTSTMGTFDGTVSTDNAQGDYATLSFAGSQIKVYANELTGYGTATFTVDGSHLQTVTLTPANTSPNGDGSGDVLVYTVSGLTGSGLHTLKILNNAAGNIISIDRVEITPPTGTPAELGISATDGNIIPTAQGVIPYTLNYNNAGSIVSGTGTNATGVVITETVPANTTADLNNSTAGWVLTSGSGAAGSTYTFTVGALNAGVTGSVVFSVDLNASIPVGTTSITDSFSISDAAADMANGARLTPVPPPAEVKLVFSTEPPANGSANIALSPAVAVAAEDQFNNTFTLDSTSSVTLTLNGGGTFVGGGATVTAQLSNGVATFNNLLISSGGTYTLTATDGGLTSSNSSSFTIAASSQLAFTQQPTQTVAGVTISPSVTVAVETQSNTIVTTDSSTIILKINNGSFANGSTTVSAQAVNGVATFNNLMIDATGSYNLIASDGTLPTKQSNPFNIVATATKLVFTQQPNNTYAYEAINPSVAVSLEDGFGNVATGNASTVTLTLNGGTFFGGGTTATAQAVNGVATFNSLVLTTPGTYTLTATDPSLASATSFAFTIGNYPSLAEIDDDNAHNTGNTPQVVYSATANWVQSPTSLANNYGGTVTADSTGGDTATVTFTGTLITLYAIESPTAGSAQIFIDGNSPTQVNLSSSTTMIAPVYASPLLTAGTSHTIVVKVVSGSVAIDRFVVGPATPTLAWATPADLTYGSALDGTELDAYVTNFASFPGTFTYSPVTGTMLPVGQHQPLTVSFAPTDSTDYDSANAEVFINVDKATPVITWNGPNGDMTYGQALGPNQLDATATINGNTIPGTFVYTPGAGTVPPTGENFDLSLIFTPTNTTDYNSVTIDSDINVDPATPVITWTNPADIIDGTPLSATQLDATATFNGSPLPGTFVYSPAVGTVLPVGQHQSLGVTFSPTDNTDFNVGNATAYINVDYGPPALLAFTQQPSATSSGTDIFPPVTVAVEDSAGTTLPGNTDTVKLTLSSGTFVGGGTTATARAVNGVATFSSLAITNNGLYTLTASDGNLPTTLSDSFAIGATAFVNFNNGANDFINNFATNQSGVEGGTSLTWNTTAGIDDQTGGAAGGGVAASNTSTDETAIYTPVPFNLSDGNVHTVSEFITAAAGLNSGDRNQIGFTTSLIAGFNGGYSFISARLLGNHQVEFQSGNGTGTSAVTGTPVTPTGTINSGDWLQLVFTTQETASGSFSGTFSLLDYGPTGSAAPTIVLAPVPYAVTGLTTIGTGSTMYAGFRSATGGEFTSPLDFDNFMVDSTAAHMGYLSQPSTGVTGTPLAPFVVAVEDINSNILVGDTSTVTITLSHGTFSNGQSTATATAVDGIATFNNLMINTPGSYILRATDANPNLDPAYGPVTINALPSITTQPANATADVGGTVTFTTAAAGTPTPTVQWTVSTNGGTSFSTIVGATSPTLTLQNVTAAQDGDEFEAVYTNSAGSTPTNPAILTVDFAPAVTTQPMNTSAIVGTTATITAVVSGEPAPTVQWMVSTNGGTSFSAISGATSATLTLTNVALSQSGYEYEAVFTNNLGTVTTSAATLTVTAILPVVTTQPQSVTVSSGNTATFTAAATGNPTPTVQWEVSTNGGVTFSTISNGSVYGGVTTSTLTVVSTGLNGDEYEAVFTNLGGSVASNGATLSLTNYPKVTAQPVSIAVAAGSNATFSVAGSGSAPLTLQWRVSTNGGATFTNISGATTSSLTITNVSTALSGNLYDVVITDGLGTATSNPATLTVVVATAVTLQPMNQMVDAGQTATFNAGASGNPAPTVQWQVSTNGGTSYAPISGATYTTLMLTNSTGSQNGNKYEAVFTNLGGTVTTTAATLSVDSVTTQPSNEFVNAGSNATFTAQTSNPGGADTVQWQVNTGSGFINLSNSVVYSGATSTALTITAVATGMSGYQYQAVFSNSAGTLTTSAVTLAVDSITTQPSNQTVNSGQTASFTAAVSNPGGADTVQWQVNTGSGYTPLSDGGAYSGSATTTLTVTGALTAMSGYQYEAVFTNGAGTLTTSAATLTVVPPLLVGLPVVNGSSAVINIVSASGNGTTATITTDGTPHGFWVGELVTLTGVTPGGPGGLAGTVTITGVSTGTTFQFASTYSGSETLSGATVTAALAGAQRSMVDSIVYNFNQLVNLTAAAFSISVVVNNTSTGSEVGVAPLLNVAAVPFTTEWVVTFFDPTSGSVIGNSIANGAYSITINPALVTSISGGQNLAEGETDTFYRLYGDLTSAQSVKNVDANAFNRAWGNAYYSAAYNAALDYNDDGKYTNIDANAFNRAFNTRYQLTTTI